MSKSSTEYTELFGLRNYLGVLQSYNAERRCSEWVYVHDWVYKRVKYLEEK